MQSLSLDGCSRFSARMRREATLALDRAWPVLCHPVAPLGARPMRVAHLGCASGDVTSKVLAPRYPETVQIIGTDPDPAMVEYAMVNQRTNPGLFYTSADIEGLEKRETTLWKLKPYSHVFSFNCVKSLLPESVSLSSVTELLAPGGTALFTMIASPIYRVYKMLATVDRYSKYMEDVEKHVPPYELTEENYMHYLENLMLIGLDVLGTKFDNYQCFTFNSEEQLIDYIIAIDPFIRRMTEDDRRDYLDQVLCMCRGFFALTASPKTGHHYFNFSRLTLVVRKRWWWCLL